MVEPQSMDIAIPVNSRIPSMYKVDEKFSGVLSSETSPLSVDQEWKTHASCQLSGQTSGGQSQVLNFVEKPSSLLQQQAKNTSPMLQHKKWTL
jgi:hypothetical protein